MPLLPGKYPIPGVDISRDDIITVENATVLWPNFSGTKTLYNSEGDRNFNLHLTKQQEEEFTRQGWNVKCKPPRPEDEDQVERCTLKIVVKYVIKPPRVKAIGDKTRNETMLDEGNIGLLDDADIKTVDLTFVPYFYDINGSVGVAAYLRSMYVELIEDELDMKWDAIKQEEA